MTKPAEHTIKLGIVGLGLGQWMVDTVKEIEGDPEIYCRARTRRSCLLIGKIMSIGD